MYGEGNYDSDATVIDRAKETPPENRAMVKVHVRGCARFVSPSASIARERAKNIDRSEYYGKRRLDQGSCQVVDD